MRSVRILALDLSFSIIDSFHHLHLLILLMIKLLDFGCTVLQTWLTLSSSLRLIRSGTNEESIKIISFLSEFINFHDRLKVFHQFGNIWRQLPSLWFKSIITQSIACITTLASYCSSIFVLNFLLLVHILKNLKFKNYKYTNLFQSYNSPKIWKFKFKFVAKSMYSVMLIENLYTYPFLL